ncbi:MAG: acyl-CoA dehydratase activase [Thermodesulfobacteriota bacterium]|nr:acyl-CoA dehydratase activase [Thermodesulfobacteriota bacterium]
MACASNILGIDIGSVSVAAAEISLDKKIISRGYTFHHGNIPDGLKRALLKTDLANIAHIAVTSSTHSSVKRDEEFDDQVSIIRASKHLYNKIGSILNVGGEKFSLSLFDEHGNYSGSKNNTSCAAGTGSFLDQQASRLGLETSRELARQACDNTSNIPDIATRCAVFAKTDLIHAQQEGFSVPQICDGLCKGLAKNLFNTLFTKNDIRTPVIFCGGVAKNSSVKAHLESLAGTSLTCDPHSHLYGALGTALCMADNLEKKKIRFPGKQCYATVDDLLYKQEKTRKYFYPELKLKFSDYPDFSNSAGLNHKTHGVEVDIYIDPEKFDSANSYLGVDVGSTSTKAVIITETGEVMAGFYTRTASKPVDAVQKIFKSADSFCNRYGIKIDIKGCGTTGSGRKISAGIIGADLVLDEISAHARAAYELNRDVDTIIEIGGQDAKFTTMKDGVVTSSFMNTVCAAGTGSFIEEQALKLGCSLNDYSSRTESAKSPASSDRCTVFMERDINHFLSENYRVEEVLASALHSVRDNYLTKVATVAKIGKTVLFQGATAKNKSLIAAFEQKLKQPIHVSKFCHLTGALGVALTLKEQKTKISKFRGFNLWEKSIPVRQEVCNLCTNNCKLTIATIDNETVAFGFLCGRDYDTNHYVAKKKSYNLLAARKKVTDLPEQNPVTADFTIGIPAALHLVEDLDLWKFFFNRLGIKTITSEKLKSPVSKGRALASAEFCTPVISMHSHVSYLLEKSDYVFLPFYFEERTKDKNKRRQFCYYTQYLPSIVSTIPGINKERLISPVIKYLYTNFYTKIELYRSLKKISDKNISFFDISSAYDKALEWKKGYSNRLKNILNHKRENSNDVDVVLLGRPYTILSPTLNSSIPDIFSSLKIKTFFQDMLEFSDQDFSMIDPLLNEIHWKHAATIMKAALVAARTRNLYPVYITSFKCSPDAFGVDYFKKIMEAHNKPYLVLELDEHDSNVGYETRIEAAVRAFRNHKNYFTPLDSKEVNLDHLNCRLAATLNNKTIIYPNWDPITGRLLAATLAAEGYNTILMEETDDTIRESLKTNTGQCIPLNAIAIGYAQTIKNHNLNPEKCVLWMSRSDISCNIKMYPSFIKSIVTSRPGMEKADVYRGDFAFKEISIKAAVNAYFAYMFGGLIRKVGCKIRPYEKIKGETDRAIEKAAAILETAFKEKGSKEDALAEALSFFAWIDTVKKEKRPKVGIFGDFYVRDNDIMNQNLIHFIEENGGEVVPTPYYRFAKMIAGSYFKKWFNEGKYLNLISYKTLLVTMNRMEKQYYKYFKHLLNENDLNYTESHEEILARYDLKPEHTGESMDNILKIHYTIKEYPDLALFVQTSPSFCCPALVTEAMAANIEKKSGVPIVSVTYDGSGGNRNRVIIPFLQYTREKSYSHSFKKPA